MDGDIAAFLEARYAEDEANAGDLIARWKQERTMRRKLRDSMATEGNRSYNAGFADAIDNCVHEAEAANGPARVLAQVAAGRARLAEHAIGRDPCDAHDPLTLASEPCQTLRIDAGVYADHPDFKGAWQ